MNDLYSGHQSCKASDHQSWNAGLIATAQFCSVSIYSSCPYVYKPLSSLLAKFTFPPRTQNNLSDKHPSIITSERLSKVSIPPSRATFCSWFWWHGCVHVGHVPCPFPCRIKYYRERTPQDHSCMLNQMCRWRLDSPGGAIWKTDARWGSMCWELNCASTHSLQH